MSDVQSTPPPKGQRRKQAKSTGKNAVDTTPAQQDHLSTPNSSSGRRVPSPHQKNASPARHNHQHGSGGPVSDVESNNSANGSTRKPNKSHNHRQRKSEYEGEHTGLPVSSVDGAAASRNSSATPAKQAYAGPTFHASPAASSLPMPRFLSRSMPPNADQPSTLQKRLNAEGDGAETSTPPPESSAPTQNSDRQATPLDFFFNAQRAEQARQRSVDANTPSTIPHNSRERSIQTPNGSSHLSPPTTLRRNQPGSSSGKELFMMELDGTDDSQAEDDNTPRRSFQQRIDAARAHSSDSHSDMDEEQRKAKSAALKKLLMTQDPRSSQMDPRELESPHQNAELQARGVQAPATASHGPKGASLSSKPHLQKQFAELPGSPLRYASPESNHSQPATTSVPQRAASSGNPSQTRHNASPFPENPQPTPDVRSMEDSLRRILKMDSGPSA